MNAKVTHFMGALGPWLIGALIALHVLLNKLGAMTPELTTTIQIGVMAVGAGHATAILHSALVQRALIFMGALGKAADAAGQVANDVKTITTGVQSAAAAVPPPIPGAKS